MNIMADRIKSLRLEKGISQQELSENIGIGRSTLANYEQGKREPNIETLELFADFFNVDMNYLTGYSNIRNINKLLATLHIPCDYWPDEDDDTRVEKFLSLQNAIEQKNFENNFSKKEQVIRTIRKASDNMTDEDLDKMIELLSVAFKEAFNKK